MKERFDMFSMSSLGLLVGMMPYSTGPPITIPLPGTGNGKCRLTINKIRTNFPFIYSINSISTTFMPNNEISASTAQQAKTRAQMDYAARIINSSFTEKVITKDGREIERSEVHSFPLSEILEMRLEPRRWWECKNFTTGVVSWSTEDKNEFEEKRSDQLTMKAAELGWRVIEYTATADVTPLVSTKCATDESVPQTKVCHRRKYT